MNDPQEEYVHPVIAAMQTAYAQMQGAKKQQFEQALADKEQQLREDQFAEAQRQHKDESSRAQQQLDINKTLLEMQQRQEQLHRANEIQDFFYKGGHAVQAPDLQLPGASNPLIAGSVPGISMPQLGKQIIPGTNEEVNPAGFSTPEEAQQRNIKNIIDTTTAQQTALTPFEQAKSDRDKANRLAEIGLQGTNAAEVARVNHANQLDLENLHGHFQLAAAQIAHQHGNEALAPVFNGALNSIMDGQTSYSTLPKDLKEGVSQLAATKGWTLPTNQKDYSSKLDAVSGIQGLLDQYRDLALNHSRDSAGTGIAGTLSTITGSPSIPFTDLKSKVDSLKANGGSLASFFDKQNRKSDAEILRQVSGLFDPRSTIQQNLDKISQHREQLNTAVKGIFAGFKPDQLNYVLGSRGISDLGGFDSGSVASKTPSGKTAIKLDDGTIIPDTPQNRQLHGLQ
jgi:hypothetical protein